MMPRARVFAAAFALMTIVTAGCSSSDDEPTPSSDATTTSVVASGITEAEAIEIARGEVESSDPDFDFSKTHAVVVPSTDTFDVSFPDSDPTSLGGEPHVVVDRSTGDVIESYLTR